MEMVKLVYGTVLFFVTTFIVIEVKFLADVIPAAMSSEAVHKFCILNFDWLLLKGL
jgi:hypothetical protein